jgi:hypothetical protein
MLRRDFGLRVAFRAVPGPVCRDCGQGGPWALAHLLPGALAGAMAATASSPALPGPPVIEGASPTDRAFLAMDSGEVPEQFGVILLLDQAGGFDLSRARRLIAERIPAVPRLRQWLIRAPFGCGGPIWVDDPGFDIRHHVRAVGCGEPGDEPALLDTGLAVIAAPLRRTAPLWSAVLVTGLADGTLALVLVLHHALADGVGGLAVLANLVDARADAPSVCFPRPPPPRPGSPTRRSFAGCGGCATARSRGTCCVHQ